MHTRREYVPGRQYFFTLHTTKHFLRLASPGAVCVLNVAFQQAMRKYPFEMDAIVILPDHLHCLWTLPPGDEETAKRWRVVKFWFSSHCDAVRCCHGEPIWKGNCHERPIRNDLDYRRHVDFIHYNAVSHGMADLPGQWPHSSFDHYVRMGWLHPEWGKTRPELPESMFADYG